MCCPAFRIKLSLKSSLDSNWSWSWSSFSSQLTRTSPISFGVNFSHYFLSYISGKTFNICSTSDHLNIMCILALCTLFHGLVPFPYNIAMISSILVPLKPWSLYPSNLSGHPFFETMWEKTLTGTGRMFVLRKICMHVYYNKLFVDSIFQQCIARREVLPLHQCLRFYTVPLITIASFHKFQWILLITLLLHSSTDGPKELVQAFGIVHKWYIMYFHVFHWIKSNLK